MRFVVVCGVDLVLLMVGPDCSTIEECLTKNAGSIPAPCLQCLIQHQQQALEECFPGGMVPTDCVFVSARKLQATLVIRMLMFVTHALACKDLLRNGVFQAAEAVSMPPP